jgi:hypothetical protein
LAFSKENCIFAAQNLIISINIYETDNFGYGWYGLYRKPYDRGTAGSRL